ncbi:hypothetical protein [Salipiger mangrovisoli]|uniref:Uncharacterized protein n=1 Tax=Salipiger mangrovisoli TaxID=2865933 RepID=A0ABR9WW58_9RHOB|nr:hypothetical protein [Salipiger mangrovisoli]MBE9635517.1 hypothetical protein [Salipiger mangrovisoli]
MLESIRHSMRVIGDRIAFLNNRRPDRALALRTPAEAFRLAALPAQSPLCRYRAAEREASRLSRAHEARIKCGANPVRPTREGRLSKVPFSFWGQALGLAVE